MLFFQVSYITVYDDRSCMSEWVKYCTGDNHFLLPVLWLELPKYQTVNVMRRLDIDRKDLPAADG